MGNRPNGEKERIAVRRLFVMRLKRQGKSTREIRDLWNQECVANGRENEMISAHKTIAEDIKYCLSEIAEENKMETHAVRELLTMRLDQALGSVNFQRDIDNGRLDAIKVLVSMTDTYAKLYGAYAPTKIAQTDISGEKDIALMTEEERAKRVAELMSKAAERREIEELDAEINSEESQDPDV